MTHPLLAVVLAAVDCAICLALGVPLVAALGVACAAFAIATVALSVVASSEEGPRGYGLEPLGEPEVFRTNS